MTESNETDWMKRQAAAIGTRVRAIREAQGLGVQAVADECTRRGYKLLRTALANLEAGARKNITVAEVSVLADVLGVSPMHLILPLDESGKVEPLPGKRVDPWYAWLWFIDGKALLGTESDEEFDDETFRGTWAARSYGVLERMVTAWNESTALIQKRRESRQPVDSLITDRDYFAKASAVAYTWLTHHNLPVPDEMDKEMIDSVEKHVAEARKHADA